MSNEYLKRHFDVYALSLAVMKSQKDKGIPINEGICFEIMNCKELIE